MASVVNLGGVQFGGSSNQVGVYNRKNMQNAGIQNHRTLAYSDPQWDNLVGKGLCLRRSIPLHQKPHQYSITI